MGVNRKMKIYKTTRCVTYWDVNEEDFLNYLKRKNPNDEDIQKVTNLKELIKEFGDLNEFDIELNQYINSDTCRIIGIPYSSNYYYDNYLDAYNEIEYGVH